MQPQLNLLKGINTRDLDNLNTESGEGAFALDHDGKLIFMNAEAELLLGWHLPELAGKNFIETTQFKFNQLSTMGASKCGVMQSVGCSHLHQGAVIQNKEGVSISISFISLPVFDSGKVQGKMYVFRQSDRSCTDDAIYRNLVDEAGSIIIKLDGEACIEYANDYARFLLGDKLEFVVPASIRAAVKDNPNSLRNSVSLVNRGKVNDGHVITISWSVNASFTEDGILSGLVCIGNTLSEYETKPKALLPDKILAQKVFNNISDGVITMDQNGAVEYLNPVAEQLTGWNTIDARGLLVKDIFHVVDEKTREPIVESILSRVHEIKEKGAGIKGVLLRRDGWEFSIEESSTAIRDQNGIVIGAVVIFRDISEMSGMDRWMAYETIHDPLTGLLNRAEFESALTQALNSVRTEGRQHVLCYIDIDEFHAINQEYGRYAGDEILKEIAMIFRSKVRDSDVLARIGNDEYGVLLKNCTLENAMETAKSFFDEINHVRFDWEGKIISLGISIGMVPVTSKCGGLADIIRIADSACYVAKDKGRNRIHVYQDHDVDFKEREDELRWVYKIRDALDEDRFRLYCQSIVPLKPKDNQEVHHEILLRMEQDDGTIIRPASFISAAERYNMMPSIDRWVVENSLALLSDRAARNDRIGVFAINLSAQSLVDDNFLGFVIDQIDKSEIPTANICFEITETTAISNLMTATRFMSILRGMGCRFSLDDFGRGFSSYAYLKNLNIDFLKIDGTFVRDLHHDPVDMAMVESINQIGHIMGVETIAEFVENKEILEKLMALGVDHVQGYQLGKPRPLWHSVHAPKSLEAVN